MSEALYWLELLEATNYLTLPEAQSLCPDATELLKLLTSSLKTAKTPINH
ncbi:hypothetical protein [Hymenobacter ginkgonis]|nr:hypothetical protein [Hymenobacter ginkgonis]